MRCLLLVGLLGGCYMQGGLGAAPGQATLHGSMGLIGHFGEVASVRAGAGGGIGPYKGGTESGSLSTKPIAIGAEATLVASGRRSLVVTADVQPPFQGRLHIPNFDSSEKATTMRAYLGVGYHHVWSQEPKNSNGPSRPVAAITTALGPELWYARDDVHATSTRFGGAFSLMLEMRATLIGEMFDCLGAKNGCD